MLNHEHHAEGFQLNTHVRSHAVQAQPLRRRGQDAHGKSFPCLQAADECNNLIFADPGSWANA